MKSTGIVRKIDSLGRIVLPMELRRSMDIGERDAMEIYMDNGRIILQKFEQTSIFCGSSGNLAIFRGKNVCPECAQLLSKMK